MRFSVLNLMLLASLGGLAGCSVATTRPIQEMTNAEVALRAARDVNADSLVPEVFRRANEHYFRAKQEYRLKNFGEARKNAVLAMRLAEEAEFRAFRAGGATPESSTSGGLPPEGAFGDPEAEFRSRDSSVVAPSNGDFVPTNREKPTPAEPNQKGMSYDEYKDQERAEQEQAEREKEKAKEKPVEKKPEGQTGPTGAIQKRRYGTVTVSSPDRVAPGGGGLPNSAPTTSRQLQNAGTERMAVYEDVTPRELEWAQKGAPPIRHGEPIPEMGSTERSFADTPEAKIPEVGSDPHPVYNDIQEMKHSEMPSLDSAPPIRSLQSAEESK